MKYAVLGYLLFINAYAFLRMGADKKRAQRSAYRISERALMLPAILFGAAGAYCGMRYFRHKTKHAKFAIGLPALLFLQLALAGIALNRWL